MTKAIVSLVFLVTLFGNVALSHADINEYINLFDGTDPAKGLTMQIANFTSQSGFQGPGTWTTTTPTQGQGPVDPTSTTPTQVISSFKFNFQGSFLPVNDIPYKEKKWAYIKDFYTGTLFQDFVPHVFMLRICDINPGTGAIDGTKCVFSDVPYAHSPMNNDLKGDGTPLCPTQSTCTIPSEETPTSKIYHYRAKLDTNTGLGFQRGDTQYAKFNVTFLVGQFAPLLSNGTLGAYIAKNDKFKVGDPTEYQAELWYCGQNTNGNQLNLNSESESVQGFNNLCGGNKPYFRIASSQKFRMPATNAEAASQTEASVAAANTSDTQTDTLPNCGIGVISGTFVGCIAQLVYYFFYVPIQWFAGIMGNLFDFFLGYSLSDTSYRAEFAVRGWQLVRDISNIFFIIILVWTGLSAVFNTKTNMKSVVASLILNAILINFSLFATRVVIDISNVVARVFYNSVEVCEGKCEPRNSDGNIPNLKEGTGNFKPLSEKIVSAFNPQKLFSAKVLSANKALPNKDGSGTTAVDLNSYDYATYYIVVSLIAAIILFAVAVMFWKTTFMFLGRVIGLYLCMIFAPFAVLTQGNIPFLNSISELSWKKWLSDLTGYALLAPIFVFFLYIVYSFLETDFITVYLNKDSGSFLEIVIYTAIPMLIVYMMIKQGVKIAEKYAGFAGKLVQNYSEKAVGFVGGAALGVATGGAALAGRNTLGRLGTRLAESKTLQDASASGKWYARLADRTMQTGTKMSTATYDARNSAVGKRFEKETGIGLDNKLVKMTGTGTNKTQGGFKEAISRNEKVLVDRAERFQLRGAAAVTQDKKNKAWEAGYDARRKAAETTDLANGVAFNEVDFRQNDLTAQAAQGNKRVETTTEVNRAREKTYQAKLARGTFLSRVAQRSTNRVTTPGAAVGAAATAAGASVVTGGAIVGAAAAIGQGAIQGAARENVINSRESKAKDTISAGERTKLEGRLKQLGVDKLRMQQTLSPVARHANNNDLDSLTVLDVQNYQASNVNHGMASPNTVIAERNRINSDISSIRKQLGLG